MKERQVKKKKKEKKKGGAQTGKDQQWCGVPFKVLELKPWKKYPSTNFYRCTVILKATLVAGCAYNIFSCLGILMPYIVGKPHEKLVG